MKTHELKTWPEPFLDVIRGFRLYEVRNDDRHFKVGDLLVLKEYDPKSRQFSGRWVKAIVIHKLPGNQFGIEKGFCVLGIKITGKTLTP